MAVSMRLYRLALLGLVASCALQQVAMASGGPPPSSPGGGGSSGGPPSSPGSGSPYLQLKTAIAAILPNQTFDDGSYVGFLTRLAWHTSGTYNHANAVAAVTDADRKLIGGSCGARMRFNPESGRGANVNLDKARALLEPLYQQFKATTIPNLSYSDLWTLGGVVAVEQSGGPAIKWRPGRLDYLSTDVQLDSQRLPDAWLNQSTTPDDRTPEINHVYKVFTNQMNWTIQETVALIGAHSIGRCHPGTSGFDGVWDQTPTQFSNHYFQRLQGETWFIQSRDAGLPVQYKNTGSGNYIMLPTDIALARDPAFSYWVNIYQDQNRFFTDFAAAFSKLLELGCAESQPDTFGKLPYL